jgi:cell division protein FtsL
MAQKQFYSMLMNTVKTVVILHLDNYSKIYQNEQPIQTLKHWKDC